MNRHAITSLFAAVATGGVFGVGIALSGMMNPETVLNFFDVFGTWDPTLAMVMVGALLVTAPGYRVIWRSNAPLFQQRFLLPTNTAVDKPLVFGSALFGIGWGIAGFCPGAALPALGTGRWEPVLFVLAVIAGITLRRVVQSFSHSLIKRPA